MVMGIRCFIFGLIFISLLSIISAQEVNINVKNNFYSGELLFFEYQIISNIHQTIEISPYIICPNSPNSLAQKIIINLNKTSIVSLNYSLGIIDENFQTANCKAGIIIFSPFFREYSKNFSITTESSFDFNLILQKKVFIKGDSILLDYSSNIQGINIDSKLTYPDGKKEQINLPKSIKADEIGTYELELTVSKQGYKIITKKEQFGVIEKQAEISNFGTRLDGDNICNNNGNCENEENIENCPVDCLRMGNFQKNIFFINNNILYYLILFIVIFVIILLVILIYKLIKKQNSNLTNKSNLNFKGKKDN